MFQIMKNEFQMVLIVIVATLSLNHGTTNHRTGETALGVASLPYQIPPLSVKMTVSDKGF
jgi:hypothetical protein